MSQNNAVSNGNGLIEEVQINASQQNQYTCSTCSNRTFNTYRGLSQHARHCTKRTNETPSPATQHATLPARQEVNELPEVSLSLFQWGERDGAAFTDDLNKAYEKIVFWKKNLFMLPTGNAGKNYIKEVTRLLNAWTHDTPLRLVSLKAIHTMPALLLQKPSKTSKSKDHLNALERRLELWIKGDINSLLLEAETIQERLKNNNSRKNIADISKKFAKLMGKGNINGALKLLTNNMVNGVLPLDDNTLNSLKQKHPKSQPACEETLINGDPPVIHPVVFEDINEELVRKAAIRTKGGSGPSGLDADGWRRILTSKAYGTCASDLRKSIAEFIKYICINEIEIKNNRTSLESFIASRLVPLDKNPGLRPIGVGEVLRRIAGKVVMSILKDDVTKAVGNLQLCGGQDAGCEAAVHSMHDIFTSNETEAVLLVDAENAFNSINRQALLHNIKFLCPTLATFVRNCYNVSARLFILGGKEIQSNEGTTQGDPTAMAVYGIGLTPLLNYLLTMYPEKDPKIVAFADDLSSAGKISKLYSWWKDLLEMGPKFGYFPKPSKTVLIVKPEFQRIATEVFENTNIKVTISGERHLGAVIGSEIYRRKYVEEMINKWKEELLLLSKIAEIQPQAAYSAYIHGFKSKYNYFNRTIPTMHNHLNVLEDVLRNHFIPAIIGESSISDHLRQLLALPIRLGGLALNFPHFNTEAEYNASRTLTEELIEHVVSQNTDYNPNRERTSKIKSDIKKRRTEFEHNNLGRIRENMSREQLRANDILQQPGCNNWLNIIPIEEFNYTLNKQQFLDAVRLRYQLSIPNLPTRCPCGERFDTQHAMSCKKGGFVTLRHNQLRDITGFLLQEVCHDVSIEPLLQPVTDENAMPSATNTNDGARLDVSARNFWIMGQKAFFDVRVFDPNASRYQSKNLEQCFTVNEREKKRSYNRRILEVEHASFTPLVFTIHGAMGTECRTFVSRLSELLAIKRDLPKSIVTSWVRTKISFALIRSMLMCLRGSRTVKNNAMSITDIEVQEKLSRS